MDNQSDLHDALGGTDLYAILGVNPQASDTEIKAAWRSMAARTHPDHGGDETAFRLVSEAFEVLRDPVLRQCYDSLRQASPSVSEGSTTSGQNQARRFTDASPGKHRQSWRFGRTLVVSVLMVASVGFATWLRARGYGDPFEPRPGRVAGGLAWYQSRPKLADMSTADWILAVFWTLPVAWLVRWYWRPFGRVAKLLVIMGVITLGVVIPGATGGRALDWLIVGGVVVAAVVGRLVNGKLRSRARYVLHRSPTGVDPAVKRRNSV